MKRMLFVFALLLGLGTPQVDAQPRWGAAIYVSATAPADSLLAEGHLWYDSSTNTLKVVTGLNPTIWTALGGAAGAPTPLTCDATTEKLRWTGAAWECVTDQTGAGGGLPAGAAVFILSGSCATTLGAGWAEAAIGGKFLLATTNAAGDIGGTGGADTITDVINHAHPVNITDPGHGHGLTRYPTTTGGLSGFTADTSMSGTPAAVSQVTGGNYTGVTATTSNPAGGVASLDNRPAFVKVIACVKQ